ncbi:hypothetical protein ACQY0O_005641 [Thecaphora frezii]
MRTRFCLLSVLVALASVSYATIDQRTDFVTVPHNKLIPIKGRVSGYTFEQNVALQYKPLLHIQNGCNNYPAVDDDGRLSQGLSGSGEDDGDCRDPDGPSYVRWKYLDAKNTSLAIVTAFYFPKSMWSFQKRSNMALVVSGERHHWQCLVSFFTVQRPHNGPPVANLTSIAFQEHGFSHVKYDVDEFRKKERDGDHFKFKMAYDDERNDVVNHLTTTGKKGREQSMLFYEDFSSKVQLALDNFPFYRSKSPVATGIFDNIVQSTWYLESTKHK